MQTKPNSYLSKSHLPMMKIAENNEYIWYRFLINECFFEDKKVVVREGIFRFKKSDLEKLKALSDTASISLEKLSESLKILKQYTHQKLLEEDNKNMLLPIFFSTMLKDIERGGFQLFTGYFPG